MSIDIELEIAEMLRNGKKILVVGSISMGKTYLTNEILKHFDTDDVIKYYAESKDSQSYTTPLRVLNDNVFIDMLYKALVFDCGYGFNEVAFTQNRKFEKVRNCLCGVLITATSGTGGLVDQKGFEEIRNSIPTIEFMFDVVIEILPNYEYKLHQYERVG
ncbi:MAG: hypothetical protein K0R18_81 [Bacillales bacterium]|jgi:hypothetical protein|nr:hypothetical protein [Bacillales bacterium]